MIVPMHKIHLVARAKDQHRLLEALRQLGVLHLVPVDPADSAIDDQTARRLHTMERALQVLSGVKPRGPVPDIDSCEAAREVLDIQRRTAEGRSHLATLYHQLEKLGLWGDLRLTELQRLDDAGIQMRFYSMLAKSVPACEAECVEVVGRLPGRRVLVAVASRSKDIGVPADAVEQPLPSHDASSIRASAAAIDAEHARDLARLHELAGLVPALRATLTALQEQADFTVAREGGVTREDLFAVQGWIPSEAAGHLTDELTARGMAVAVQSLKPDPEEEPPTLIHLPKWARPVDALLRMLGTVPGYREFDVSIPFLLALPLFTALLISDGGYGALLLLIPLLTYRQTSRMIGARFTQLLMLVGAAALLWGVIIGTFFGFTLYTPFISVDLTESSRVFMMWLSFTLGAVHLSIAQLWRSVHAWPDLRLLNGVGWALFIWGMYGVVNMFVLHAPMGWNTPWPYMLLTGAALAIGFASPGRNIAKSLALGVARFPLSMLSAFSDVISYVRLMAVGLASSVLAVSFNEMAFSTDSQLLSVIVLVLGHGLNMGLALIAMFAHGVRLNMLEFSSNLGMQWTGYAYQPFSQLLIEEHSR